MVLVLPSFSLATNSYLLPHYFYCQSFFSLSSLALFFLFLLFAAAFACSGAARINFLSSCAALAVIPPRSSSSGAEGPTETAILNPPLSLFFSSLSFSLFPPYILLPSLETHPLAGKSIEPLVPQQHTTLSQKGKNTVLLSLVLARETP